MTGNQEFQQEKHSVFQSYSGRFSIIGRTNIISVMMAIVPCFETVSSGTAQKSESITMKKNPEMQGTREYTESH